MLVSASDLRALQKSPSGCSLSQAALAPVAHRCCFLAKPAYSPCSGIHGKESLANTGSWCLLHSFQLHSSKSSCCKPEVKEGAERHGCGSCRGFFLEEETGATVSSAVAKSLSLPFMCSHLCSLGRSGSGGVKNQRSAMSKGTSESLQTEPFRRQVMIWDQAVDGDMHMETIQLEYNSSKLLH